MANNSKLERIKIRSNLLIQDLTDKISNPQYQKILDVRSNQIYPSISFRAYFYWSSWKKLDKREAWQLLTTWQRMHLVEIIPRRGARIVAAKGGI
jgi:hypothetical protein